MLAQVYRLIPPRPAGGSGAAAAAAEYGSADSPASQGEVGHVGTRGHVDPSNRKVALLIAVIAAGLAFSETLGKSAQTDGLARHIEASDLRSFFQAKTIRMTTSAALQVAIVLATAQVITGTAFLLWGAIGLGMVGVALAGLGPIAPAALQLF